MTEAPIYRRLIIDDKRTFTDIYGVETTHVRTTDEAELLLSDRSWDEVWFDFDMGGGSTTMKLGRMVEAAPGKYTMGNVYIHTANPDGATELAAALAWFSPTIISQFHVYQMLEK